MVRSDWPVLVAVSAVKRSEVESPTWRLLVCWFSPFRVSGCNASYASFRRFVNNARSDAVRFQHCSVVAIVTNREQKWDYRPADGLLRTGLRRLTGLTAFTAISPPAFNLMTSASTSDRLP
jgi:hypothetical protein